MYIVNGNGSIEMISNIPGAMKLPLSMESIQSSQNQSNSSSTKLTSIKSKGVTADSFANEHSNLEINSKNESSSWNVAHLFTQNVHGNIVSSYDNSSVGKPVMPVSKISGSLKNTSNMENAQKPPEIFFLDMVKSDHGNKSYSIDQIMNSSDVAQFTKENDMEKGFWIAYDNSDAAKNKTKNNRDSCLLVEMSATILIPLQTNSKEQFNMSIPIPRYATNMDIACNKSIQHMTISWKIPQPVGFTASNIDNDISLDEESDDDIITIYDDDDLYAGSSLDEVEKEIRIQDLMRDARFHMVFQQNDPNNGNLRNYLSDIFLNVPFNISSNMSIITNGYLVSNHNKSVQMFDQKQSHSENYDTFNESLEKSNISVRSNSNHVPITSRPNVTYDQNTKEENKMQVNEKTYRIIGLGANLHAMEAPALYAYCCDNQVVIPLSVNMLETDYEVKTLQYSRNVSKNVRHGHQMEEFEMTRENKFGELGLLSKSVNISRNSTTLPARKKLEKVQIFVVFDFLRIEAFRKDRNYAEITHLTWDCLRGWPFGKLVPKIITIFMTCFEIMICVIFYIRYRSRKKSEANKKLNFVEDEEDGIDEERASFHSDDHSPLIVE